MVESQKKNYRNIRSLWTWLWGRYHRTYF